MKRILSIDDEQPILQVLTRILESRGYQVTTCNDPHAAMDVFKSGEFDLVTLDIRMPGKDGFELYKELREHADLPALFCTAYPKSFTTDSDDVVEMWQQQFADGNTDIIYKPFDLDDLFAKVEGLIGTPDE